ncbi:MAG: hypothetical protein IJF18_03650 [Oscillospiraceae bacterium]|nr:hypothetical protein [Oscillospiraceae bacterium]
MSRSNKNKTNPVVYGILVVIAAAGALIFGGKDAPSEAPVTTAAVTSSVTEALTEAVTEAVSSVQETTADSTVITTAETTTVTEAAEYIDYYFRNQSTLDSHYEKHGIEMGFSSAEEYEAAASDVANSPDALHKTEKEDGDDVYYIEATNEFVVVSTDGYIRTYFLPSGGKAYFDRQ